VGISGRDAMGGGERVDAVAELEDKYRGGNNKICMV